MSDQHKRRFLIGLFECDGCVPTAGPLDERVTNVGIGIARGVITIGRDEGRFHPACELLKPGQHPHSLRLFSGGALDFPA